MSSPTLTDSAHPVTFFPIARPEQGSTVAILHDRPNRRDSRRFLAHRTASSLRQRRSKGRFPSGFHGYTHHFLREIRCRRYARPSVPCMTNSVMPPGRGGRPPLAAFPVCANLTPEPLGQMRLKGNAMAWTTRSSSKSASASRSTVTCRPSSDFRDFCLPTLS